MESEEGQEEGEEDNDEGDDDDDAFGAAGCTDAAGGSLPGGATHSLGGPLLKAEPVQATRLSVTDDGLPLCAVHGPPRVHGTQRPDIRRSVLLDAKPRLPSRGRPLRKA